MNRQPFSPATGASFYDYLVAERPDLLPSADGVQTGVGVANTPAGVAHGTTVLSLIFDGGVIVAGDRMASDGHSVSSRRLDKVIQTDAYSALAISGAVGPCLDMAKLFTTELEYYEKIEGRLLSLSGKANKLGQMVRGNLAMAMQGLAVIPLFAGYDLAQERGRVFKYDVAGGGTEEPDWVTTGSGSVQARGALKRGFKPALSQTDAIGVALTALLDAAEEDLATAGPDSKRGIYPTVMVITGDGVTQLSPDDVATACDTVAGEGSP